MIFSILVAAGCFASAYGHGYLTIPASRTRLGFEVRVQVIPFSLHNVDDYSTYSRLVLIRVPNVLSWNQLQPGLILRKLKLAGVGHVATMPVLALTTTSPVITGVMNRW